MTDVDRITHTTLAEATSIMITLHHEGAFHQVLVNGVTEVELHGSLWVMKGDGRQIALFVDRYFVGWSVT